MTVSSLSLTQFRSFEQAHFEFDGEGALIQGPNGSGKTNMLEALFYLSCVKSLRRAKEAEMLRFGQDEAIIQANISAYGRSHRLKAHLRRGQRRILTRDELPVTPREWLGLLPAVLFVPTDISLLAGGPGERLDFMNLALCQMKPRYTDALALYRRLHRDKQRLLAESVRKPAFMGLWEDYNRRMADTGAFLCRYREPFVQSVAELAAQRHLALSQGREQLTLRYRSHAGDADAAFTMMQSRKDAELGARRSLVGAHRDDIEVLLNGRHIRRYGSQGQLRSAVIACKLALRDVLRNCLGEAPLLLLDDVLSELDEGRRAYILNALDGGQVFITDCGTGYAHHMGRRISLASDTH